MYRRRGDISLVTGTGLSRREIFPHEVIAVAKPYPDSQLLLERRGIPRRQQRRGSFVQLNLYSLDLYGLPPELFTHPEINWHGQQFGRPGLVAAAGLFVEGGRATVSTMQSDLCQQLYRQKAFKAACKTRAEAHFKHWYVLLFNAVLDFCLDAGVAELYSPTGSQVVRTTQKPVADELFLRIYDHPATRYRCTRETVRGADYWKLSIAGNAAEIDRLAPAAGEAPAPVAGPAIAIFHDIEEDIDTPVSVAECEKHLAAMLETERRFGVAATYSVVGNLISKKRSQILASNARHAIGFHSYDHDKRSRNHLARCREVDLRVRGYRPPGSRMTSELSDRKLTYLNFEWLASSASSIRLASCRLESGLVKIPIHLDDNPLHTGVMDYRGWEAQLLEAVRSQSFVAFGLHDCYGAHWLPHYPALLESLGSMGKFVTADDICNSFFLDGETPPLADLHAPVSLMRRLLRLMAR